MNHKRMSEAAINAALDAVQLKPHKGQRQGNCSLVRDLRVAIREVYDEIAESAGGFREMSAC